MYHVGGWDLRVNPRTILIGSQAAAEDSRGKIQGKLLPGKLMKLQHCISENDWECIAGKIMEISSKFLKHQEDGIAAKNVEYFEGEYRWM